MMMNIEELEEILNNRIIEAYSLGYSVVEITRALRKTSVNFVHSLLRETGHIPVMARSEYRRKYDIDHRLAESCRKKGFSFGRWCLGWKFDPDRVAIDLKTSPVIGELLSAHAALQRDFPDVYFSIYGGNRPRLEKKKKKATTLQPSLRIDWNIERKLFVATIPEHPMLESVGSDWDETYYEIKSAYHLLEYILRLDNIINDHPKK
jgi:hypothetical protein